MGLGARSSGLQWTTYASAAGLPARAVPLTHWVTQESYFPSLGPNVSSCRKRDKFANIVSS